MQLWTETELREFREIMMSPRETRTIQQLERLEELIGATAAVDLWFGEATLDRESARPVLADDSVEEELPR
ncbi:hypothetical protein [Bradyrhizobium sp. USDA 4529]